MWEITSTSSSNAPERQRLCAEGWEPFAVTATRAAADSFGVNTTIWFRRSTASAALPYPFVVGGFEPTNSTP